MKSTSTNQSAATGLTQEAAQSAMQVHYTEARRQLAGAGAFGKTLDLKARKLALRLAGVTLPPGATIAWATPADWAEGGYRENARAARVGRPPLPEDQKTDARPRSIRLGDAHWAKMQRLGRGWLESQIDEAP